MTSPAQDVVTTLLGFGLLCLLIVMVLRRHQARLAEAQHAFEMQLIQELAQPCDGVTQPVPASQATLQGEGMVVPLVGLRPVGRIQ